MSSINISSNKYSLLEKPVKIDSNNSIKDQVLDLSGDTKNIENEILNQDTSNVSAIKVGNQFYSLSKSDLKKLVETLKKECINQGQIKDSFKSIDFINNTGLVIQERPEFNKIKANSTTYNRAIERDKITTVDEAKSAIKSDLSIIGSGKQYDFTKNKYSIQTAGKMLVQNMVVLEKLGLLSLDEKVIFKSIMDKLRDSNKGGFTLNDVKNLYDICNKFANSDVQIPEMSEKEQVFSRSDSAINDMKMSIKEDGTTYTQDKNTVKGGRSIARIEGTVKAISKEYDNLDKKLIPEAKAKLDKSIEEFNKLLIELTGKTNIDDALTAYNSDRELMSKVNANPKMRELIIEKDDALTNYNELASKRSELGEARLKGMKVIEDLLQIKISNQKATGERLEGISLVNSSLGEAISDLNNISSSIEGIENSNLYLPEYDNLPPDEKELKENEIKQEQIIELQNQVIKIQDKVAKGLEDLITKFESIKPKPAGIDKAIDLLKQQLDTVKNLNIPSPTLKDEELAKASIMDPKDMIKFLEDIRKSTIETLKKLPESAINPKETKALENLDGKVKEYSDTDISTFEAAKQAHERIGIDIKKIKIEQEKANMKADEAQNEATKGLNITNFLSTAAAGSKIDLYIGAGARLGSSKNNVYAEGTLHFIGEKKDIGNGDKYLLHLDGKLEAGYNVDVLWGLVESHGSASIQATLAGLAFDTPEQVKTFSDLLSGIYKDLKGGHISDAKSKWNKLKEFVEPFKYDDAITKKAELEVGVKWDSKDEDPTLKMGGEIESSEATYPSLDSEGKVKNPPESVTVKTSSQKGFKEIEDYGIEYSHETITSKNSSNKTDKPTAKKESHTFKINLPADVFIKMYDSVVKGKLEHINHKVVTYVVEQLEKRFPTYNKDLLFKMAMDTIKEAMLDTELVTKIHKAKELMEKAGNAVKKAGLDVEEEFKATIAISVSRDQDGKEEIDLQIGFTAKADAKTKTGPNGGAYFKLGVDVEYAKEFPIKE